MSVLPGSVGPTGATDGPDLSPGSGGRVPGFGAEMWSGVENPV